ncbi:MAG: class I SAM-dependent methyltransferase [Candidatus Peregrinibacteria bacterium]|nr:class I SAM-dependent methyltransferase [Candidatus Peregrinibacteria bacterium]
MKEDIQSTPEEDDLDLVDPYEAFWRAERDRESGNIVDEQRSYLITDRNDVALALRAAVTNLFKEEKVKPNESLLEIGCGIGYFRSLVPPKFHNSFLHTDPSELALAEARKQYPDGMFARMDAMRMDTIRSGSVDRIFGMNVFNYVSAAHRKRILDEALRVLKPGGALYALSDLQPNDRSILPELAKEANIPLRYVGTSKVHSNGVTYVKATDRREGSGYASAMSSMFGMLDGEEDGRYVATGPYLAEKVLHPVFQRRFSQADVCGIIGVGPAPLLAPACLVRTNTYARVYDVLSQSRSSVFRAFARYIDSDVELSGYRFPNLRRLEIAAIQINKGVK